ncbi:MAG: hypothetical protein OQL17_05995 [Sedimenticola sp.]|nr:hypothetical protein [Sedimenticola sp.]
MLTKRLTVWVMVAVAMASMTLSNAAAADNAVQELEWTDLVPSGYNPDEILEQYQKQYNIDELPDDDPRLKELVAKLEEVWKSAPVN